MKLFLDTMVFLHYRSIDEIDLFKLFESSDLTVVIPRITLRELDRHKVSVHSRRIQGRARMALKKIERWSNGGQVRKGISATFFPKLPTFDYSLYGLNPEWSDDILIGTILQYKLENPDEQVVLVTQDTGARMTASHLGIRVFALPDEFQLAVEPDPLEEENRELSRQIEKLRKGIPRIVVAFAEDQDAKSHAVFTVSPPPPSVEGQISRKIQELRLKFPKHKRPNEDSVPQEDSSALYPSTSSLLRLHEGVFGTFNRIPPEEYQRYNNEIDNYVVAYEEFLRSSWEYRAACLRTICFQIELRNEGFAPAEDVDAQFHFPDGFTLTTEDERPAPPGEPATPRKPRTRSEEMADRVRLVERGIPHTLLDSMFTPPSAFSLRRTNSYEIRDHFSRIKHGDTVALPRLHLTFDSFESAKSFTCRYVVRPANLPEPLQGELSFVIKQAPAPPASSNKEQIQ